MVRKLLLGTLDSLKRLVVKFKGKGFDGGRGGGRRVGGADGRGLLSEETFGEEVIEASGRGTCRGGMSATYLKSHRPLRTVHARVLADETSLAVGKDDPLKRLVPVPNRKSTRM